MKQDWIVWLKQYPKDRIGKPSPQMEKDLRMMAEVMAKFKIQVAAMRQFEMMESEGRTIQ